MKTQILILSFLIPTFLAGATGSITGRVFDKSTNKPLPNANLVIEGTHHGVAADDSGRFRIDGLPVGESRLSASCIGYQTVVTPIQIKGDSVTEVTLSLESKAIETQRVEVEAERLPNNYITDISKLGIREVDPRQVQTLAGGLDDVFRTVQMLGSAAPSGDYTSYYAVRGGSPDQNVVMLDGIILPNPYKLRLVMGGGMSIFNPLTVQDVELQTDNFSSAQGDFLSSVTEVASRDGRLDRIGGGGTINLLGASAFMEGPFPKRKGSWIVSARRTYYDLIANQLAPKQSVFPYSYDMDAKISFQISPNAKLWVKGLSNLEGTKLKSDAVKSNEESNLLLDEKARTDFYALGLDAKISVNASEKIKLAYYREKFDYYVKDTDSQTMDGAYTSKIRCVSLKEDFVYRLSDTQWLNRGIHLSLTRANIFFETNAHSRAFARREIPPDIDFREQSSHLSTYLDYTAEPISMIQARIGARYDYSGLIEKGDLSPRVSLLLKLPKKIEFHAFWGLCHQYPNALSFFVRDWPLNIALNTTALRSEKAIHYTGGFTKNWGQDILTRIDFYYKDLTRLLLPVDFVTYQSDNIGIGYSKGVELTVEKKQSRLSWFSGLISYGLGQSEYRFGKDQPWIPFVFDLRHNFSALCNFSVTERFFVTLTARFASGYPYNDLIAFMNIAGANRLVKETGYHKRFPGYSRVDLRFNYGRPFKKGRLDFYVDLTNLFDRENVYDIMWYTYGIHEESESTEQQSPYGFERLGLKAETIDMLPFIPSFGISFQF